MFYGSAKGLRTKGSQLWHQDRKGVKDQVEENEQFGTRLAAGDLNGDGYDDLAATVLGETTNDSPASFGRVAVIFGSPKGLKSGGNLLLEPFSASVAVPLDTSYQQFSLAIGNFDGDEFDDLAIGCPISTTNPLTANSGVVFVASGGASGPATSMTAYALATNGVPGPVVAEDFFGATLVVGDFDGDASDDLAIYAAGMTASPSGHGRVVVLEGSANGLVGASATTLSQDTAGVAGVAESLDQFGSVLAANDYDGDGADDLIVGVPHEDLGVANDAGVVHVFFGVPGTGVVTVGSLLLGKEDLAGASAAQGAEYFGIAVGS